MKTYEIHTLHWSGRVVAVRFCKDWSSGYRAVYGCALAHLEIDAEGTPLPCSETGYLSVFETADQIEAEGGPLAYVLDWLERAAGLPEWRDAEVARQQLSLF